jgi:hypothetical protein
MTSTAEQIGFMPALLIAESKDQFAALYGDLEQEIQPKGVIERTYVHDIANIIWEIQRLRKFKTAIINSARRPALQAILRQILAPLDFMAAREREQEADSLACDWFETQKAKKQVEKLLRKIGLDEVAVEAEAFRSRAEDLERIDRMLTALEFRRDKALRCVADYRQILSKQLQRATDRILDGDDVPRLASRSG